MERPRLSKILDFLIDSFYLGIIFFVPLFFSVFPKTFNVFELGKTVVFRSMFMLLVFFIVSKLIFFKEARGDFKNIFNKISRFLILPIIYLLGLVIINLFSDSPWISFFGSYSWQLGVISYIYFFLFFLVSLFVIQDRKYLDKVILAIFTSSFFICLYGVVQIFGADPLLWIESTSDRIISTQGQPNFLASYLLLTLPLSVFIFSYYKNKYFKAFSFFVFSLQLICLFFTHSRGGQLSLVLGTVVSGVFIFLYDRKNTLVFLREKKTYYFLASFLFLFIFFFNSLNSLYKDRLFSFNFESGSVASRINFWKAGVDAFKQKPFLGYGLDNHKNIFVKYYDKEWAVFNDVNSVPSRAHNVILEELLNGGLLGLCLWITLLFYFFKLGLSNPKKDKLSLAILLSLFYYLLSLFFSFSTVTTTLYMWLYFAILIVAGMDYRFSERKDGKLDKDKEENWWNNIVAYLLKSFFLLFLFLLVFLSLLKEERKLFADIYYLKMKTAFADEEIFETYVLYNYIKETGSQELVYKRDYANFLSGEYLNFFEEVKKRPGKKILQEILEKLPEEGFYNILARGKVFAAFAEKVGDKNFMFAQAEFNKAIKLSPKIPYAHREYAHFLYLMKNNEEAIVEIKKALDLLPDVADTRMNERHRKSVKIEYYKDYLLMGDVYFNQLMYKEAEEYYRRAREYVIGDDAYYYVSRKIADSIVGLGESDRAINFLSEELDKDPEKFYWPYLIAKIKFKNREFDESLLYINRAINLAPNNNFLKKFRNKINGF